MDPCQRQLEDNISVYTELLNDVTALNSYSCLSFGRFTAQLGLIDGNIISATPAVISVH
jgi:hypothetical protein